ncbi:MAG: HD domain-containing protein [Chloroflexota bacterium]|nr:HD domain-containing protein [Chloroflexota bacterium]
MPTEVQQILARLWQNGHAGYVVGGGVRDWLLGRSEADWDIATDARPERLLVLFPRGRYENRFGTVTIGAVEATTFRRDHRYADHRRPDSVTFSDDILDDLARRDFTVNAIAWGRAGGARAAGDQPRWVDPHAGLADLDARLLRAVGDPALRFDEDSLRLVRAARLAAQLGFEIESETKSAMTASRDLVKWVSRERIGAELRRMLDADPPSRGFRLLAETRLLEPLLPELAAEQGVPQDKIAGHDLWQHSLTTLDAAAELEGSSDRLRLAAVLHDIGKPTTYADGRFVGHDVEGARLAEALLGRLAFPRRDVQPVADLIRHHMFSYEPRWSDAAVRRLIRRVGCDLVADLLRLRQADNIGSGLPADAGHLDELRRRVAGELDAGVPLQLRDLAVDGDVLIAELAIRPGPQLGRLLNDLLDTVVADPRLNTREKLLARARALLATRQ